MTDCPQDGRVTTELVDGVMRISIDRPAKMNGFTPGMMHGLARALTDFEALTDARCAVLCAEGRHFTAGLDLPKVAEAWNRGETLYPPDLHHPFDIRPPFRLKPLIVAVKGVCFTVGVELMLSADIVIAADDSRFCQQEVRRGIMAAGGATIRLVERAGWGNAMRYLLTGEEWDAAVALRLNCVQEVVPAGQELERALEIARRISTGSAPLSVIETRRNARLAIEEGPAAAAARFDDVRQRLRQTEDATEGVRSFAEKRAPVFKGR